MAIEVHPDTIECRRRDSRAAVAFGRWLNPSRPNGNDGTWRPWCDTCLEWQRARHANDATFEYVFLDPARQRRPNPNHHDAAPYDFYSAGIDDDPDVGTIPAYLGP